jgi:hypothetical protein
MAATMAVATIGSIPGIFAGLAQQRLSRARFDLTALKWIILEICSTL